MAALRSFKTICGPLQLLLLLLLQDLVELTKPQIRSLQGRMPAGFLAGFECSVNDYPSKVTEVVWMKDRKKIPAYPPLILSNDGSGKTYYAAGSVAITLGEGDVRSQLTCQIQSNSAPEAQMNFSLGDVLRVPPKVRLGTIPSSPVQLNSTVMVTCIAERFYPENATVELFAEDAPSRKGVFSPRIPNPDGTFSIQSFLEVTATEDRNSSNCLCLVRHDSHHPITGTNRLLITRQKSENPQQHLLMHLCLPLFLSKVAVLLLISCLFLIKVRRHNRRKSHSRTSPEVRQSETST